MSTLSNENFGLIIAYLLPGFVALWGVSYFSPTVASWIAASQQGAPDRGRLHVCHFGVPGRRRDGQCRPWAIIDQLHHATGVVPPLWRFVNLEGKLQGYITLIEESLPLLPVLRQHVHCGRLRLRSILPFRCSYRRRPCLAGGGIPGSGIGSLRRLAGHATEILHPDTAITQFPLTPREGVFQ